MHALPPRVFCCYGNHWQHSAISMVMLVGMMFAATPACSATDVVHAPIMAAPTSGMSGEAQPGLDTSAAAFTKLGQTKGWARRWLKRKKAAKRISRKSKITASVVIAAPTQTQTSSSTHDAAAIAPTVAKVVTKISHQDSHPLQRPNTATLRPVATQSSDLATILRQARQMERAGNYSAARRLYQIAGSAGYGPASLRLAELYLLGPNDLKRDYIEAVHWYSKAREQGMPVPEKEKR